MAMRNWVRLPSKWIEAGGLAEVQWNRSETTGSDNAAALMVLMPIAHHADDETGQAKCTYDALSRATSLSRSKISAGLEALTSLGVIEREPNGRSTFQLTQYDRAGGWCKFPARRLYISGRIYCARSLHPANDDRASLSQALLPITCSQRAAPTQPTWRT